MMNSRPFVFFLFAMNALVGAVDAPSAVGNFALSPSQQPGPLLSFGDNIIDKGQTQVSLYADDFYSKKRVATDLFPSILYGLSDSCSLLFTAPCTTYLKDTAPNGKTVRSRGWEDLSLQLEYAYFSTRSQNSTGQATLVANMTFPTGSSSKNPPTGFGAPSYFIGATYNYTATYWFTFTSYGIVFPTKHHKTKFGNQYLYQCGVGRNIPSPKSWIFAWMAEIDGNYATKNIVNGQKAYNSGGNQIFITPSFWASSEHVIYQAGIGFPLTQHLNGRQNKFYYSLLVNISYTF